MSFTIDDTVPMPGRRNRYPFDQMSSGQSFEIVGEEEARKVRNAAYQYAKKANTDAGIAKGCDGEVKFALRKTAEADTGETEILTAEDGSTKTVPVLLKSYRLWRE